MSHLGKTGAVLWQGSDENKILFEVTLTTLYRETAQEKLFMLQNQPFSTSCIGTSATRDGAEDGVSAPA